MTPLQCVQLTEYYDPNDAKKSLTLTDERFGLYEDALGRVHAYDRVKQQHHRIPEHLIRRIDYVDIVEPSKAADVARLPTIPAEPVTSKHVKGGKR